MKIFGIGMAAAMVAVASPAYAAPLLFDFNGRGLSGAITAMFQLDSNPTPSSINVPGSFGIEQIFFSDVKGVFNGNAETASTIAFGKGLASQFQVLGTSAGFAQFGGDAVFSGTVNSPIFTPGTYNFTGIFSSGTLTISEVAGPVPEPAAWAMMIAGFAFAGAAMRRRKAIVSFA
jgi:hypothetical protein